MKEQNPWVWAVRAGWLVTGGLWGAWVGFRGNLHYSYNADSFASMFVIVFFVMFGLLGMAVGAASGIVAGGATEMGLRRLGLWTPLALVAATLIQALVIWLITLGVESNYPGLRYPKTPPPRSLRNTNDSGTRSRAPAVPSGEED